MFKSKQNPRARRAVADSTTTDEQRKRSSAGGATSKMSLCRACLVLLSPQDAAHNLHAEKELALKFLACTGGGLEALRPPRDEAKDVVLKCICHSCYLLVQQFHDFQRMCEESLLNFEKLLQEASHRQIKVELEEEEAEAEENASESQLQDEKSLPATGQIDVAAAIEEIEEIYIMEDEAAKQAQVEHFIAARRLEKMPPPATPPAASPRRRGQRQTLNCAICQRSFYKAALLEAHKVQQHRGEEPHCCVQCGKVYARGDLLLAHLCERHNGEKESFKCSYDKCGKVYRAQRSLNFHIKRQHPLSKEQEKEAEAEEVEKSHMCDKCGKSYARKAHLTRHQWVHVSKGERPFECSHCAQRFYTKQFLADHLIRRHSNLALQRCKKCGRILRSRLALANHMKQKHGDMAASWKCDVCKLDFCNSSNLRAHQRFVHAKLRPHGCGFCSAQFAKREHLEYHEMRHTGERAFKCVPCKLAFIQRGAYQRHLRAHTKD